MTIRTPPFHHATFADVHGIAGACTTAGQNFSPVFSPSTGVGSVGDHAASCGIGGVSEFDSYDVELRFTAAHGGTNNVTVSFGVNYAALWNVTPGSCNRTVGHWHYYSCIETASWSIVGVGFVTHVSPNGSYIPLISSNASWGGAGGISEWGVGCARGQPCKTGSISPFTGRTNGSTNLTWGMAAALHASWHYNVEIQLSLYMTAEWSQVYAAYGKASGLSALVDLGASVRVYSYQVS